MSLLVRLPLWLRSKTIYVSAILLTTCCSAMAQTPAATSATLAVTNGSTAVTTAAWGTTITLTATVKAGANAVHPGLVKFCDAAAAYCEDIHIVGTAQLTSNGTATMRFRPGVGSHSYKAVFVGTTSDAGSTSGVSTLSITGSTGTLATTTTIQRTSGQFGNYMVTGTVSEVGSTVAPTGSVSFLDTSNGGAQIGSATLGTATAGLTVATNYPTASSFNRPIGIAAGDFNNDGIQDIALTNGDGNTVTIMLGNGDGTFTALSATPTTGNEPEAISTADINGDGNLDLIVGNTGVNTLTVLLGDGTGAFTPQATVNTDLSPYKISIGDVNNDGVPDLVVYAIASGDIDLILGNGDGTFQNSSTLETSVGAAVLADFNGDGNLDIALPYSASTGILYGNGNGTFGAIQMVSAYNGQLAVADLNGDGKPDLVALMEDPSPESVGIMLNNGGGTFTSTELGASQPSQGADVSIGDFNGDGIPDIATAFEELGTQTIYLGKGDGTFPQTANFNFTYSATDYGLAIADYNGDGLSDIAVTDGILGQFSINLTESVETAATAPTVVMPSTAGAHLVEAQYEGAGNYALSTSGTITLFGQQASSGTTLTLTSGGAPVSTVSPQTEITLTAAVVSNSSPVTAGQVNFCDTTGGYCTAEYLVGTASLTSAGTAVLNFVPGPGQHNYIAVVQPTAAITTSTSNSAVLTVTAPTPVIYPTTTTIAQSGSIGNYTLTATVQETGGASALNGSVSFLDTSYSNASVATASIGASVGSIGYTNSATFNGCTNGVQSIVSGDFNGDGKQDVIEACPYPVAINIYFGNGDGTFTAQTPITPVGPPLVIVAGDFNGDGHTDFAISLAYSTSGMVVYLNNGNGTFTAQPEITSPGTYNQTLFTADLNIDGKLDLVVGDNLGTHIFLGNGDGTFTKVADASTVLGTLAVGDLNEDGIPDLVLGGDSTIGTTDVYLGNGDGTFVANQSGPAQSNTITNAFGAVVIGDFNGDHIPDVVVATNSTEYLGTLTTYLGKGDGTFTPVIYTGNAIPAPNGMIAADFNEDGKLDLAFGEDATVFFGNGDGSFTTYSSATVGGYSLAVADLNGDGRPDILLGTATGISAETISPTETATATVTGLNVSAGPGPHLVEAQYSNDTHYMSSTSGTTSLGSIALAPVISPNSGPTTQPTISISDASPQTTIYYTTTGALGNGISYRQYTGPIPIYENGVGSITAYAGGTGYQQSTTVTNTYTFNFPPAPTPTFSLASGTYPTSKMVTITDTIPGTTIFYTTNGTYPTIYSAVYSSPITVSSSETVVAMAAGGGYTPSGFASATYVIGNSTVPFIYTVAGNQTPNYTGDGGPATQAAFLGPQGVATDSSGNIYIADSNNNVIRKVAAGTGIITTVAGNGTIGYSGDGGAATSAELDYPTSVAVDSSGNLYIADYDNNLIRKVTASTGIITTFAGSKTASSLGDGGAATSALLLTPWGVAVDSTGNVYISNTLLNSVREVAAGTGIITTIVGGSPSYPPSNIAMNATLSFPMGLAVDNGGNLYIADSKNNSIRKVVLSAGTISTIAGGALTVPTEGFSGDGGPATVAALSYPEAVAVDRSGNVYIADTNNNAIREIYASTGIINTIAGQPIACNDAVSGDGGPALSTGVCTPVALALDSSGNIYVVSSGAETVREVTAPGAPPANAAAAPSFSLQPGAYAGTQTLTITDATPGAAIYVTLDGSTATTLSPHYQGPITITGTVTIQAVATAPGYLPGSVTAGTFTITPPPTSIISTVLGPLTTNVVQLGTLYSPGNMVLDSNGNMYISDTLNEVVWKVAASTGAQSVFAGTLQTAGGVQSGVLATNATLDSPAGLAVDGSNNLYIADSLNKVVRVVSATTGMISTYAGNGSSSVSGVGTNSLGDGALAVNAALYYPIRVALDSAGNLYISDTNHQAIRKVTASTGIISTVAGLGSTTAPGYGDGGLATAANLIVPSDIAVDGQGNLYIADTGLERVREVSASTGIITTIAGNGKWGNSGNGGPATSASLLPDAMVVDAAGNVYIADNLLQQVREVNATTGTITNFAGNGYASFSGDGGAATMAGLDNPEFLAIDHQGSIYIADMLNYRVRKVTVLSAAATPTFTPNGGSFSTSQPVMISSATQGATIYYTTDGSTPTTSSNLYGGQITVSNTEVVKAIAVASGYAQSMTGSATFLFPSLTPAISYTSPAIATAGGGAFTLTVNGSNFDSTSVVNWGSTALATQFVSSTQLTAQVPAADIATANVDSVTVSTLTLTSNAFQFEVDPAGGLGTPAFTSTTESVAQGSSVAYPVTLPSGATNVSVSCLNLPTGASCTYSSSPSQVTISTTGSTPTGTYVITIVFTETLPVASGLILLPVLMLPFARRKKNARRILSIAIVVGLGITAALAGAGCGGSSSSGGGSTTPQTQQVRSSATVTLIVH